MTALQWPPADPPDSTPDTEPARRAAAFLQNLPPWGCLKGYYLRQHSESILGPPEPSDWRQFTITCAPDGTYIVTLDRHTTLDDVHDACAHIAEACFNGNTDVEFTRDPDRANTLIHADEPNRT